MKFQTSRHFQEWLKPAVTIPVGFLLFLHAAPQYRHGCILGSLSSHKNPCLALRREKTGKPASISIAGFFFRLLETRPRPDLRVGHGPGSGWTEFGQNVIETMKEHREQLDALSAEDWPKPSCTRLLSRPRCWWKKSCCGQYFSSHLDFSAQWQTCSSAGVMIVRGMPKC